MSLVVDKFLRYISFDTQSEDEQEQQPSTQKQFVLANVLADELPKRSFLCWGCWHIWILLRHFPG